MSEAGGRWPGLQAASWPEWHHLFKESGPWVKRQIAKRAHQDFEDFNREQIVLQALWGAVQAYMPEIPPGHLKLSRPGHAAFAEGRFEPRLLWERTFSRAAYRKVVGGTTCKACQRNFWAGTRLAVHLRDSPGCGS